MAEPEFITTKEAADRLGYEVQHIRRLLHSGVLEGEKLGRDWVVRRDSVERRVIDKANLQLSLLGGRRRRSFSPPLFDR